MVIINGHDFYKQMITSFRKSYSSFCILLNTHTPILSLPFIFLKIFLVIFLIGCARNSLAISICVSGSPYRLNVRQQKKNKHQSYCLKIISSYLTGRGLHFYILYYVSTFFICIYKYDLNLKCLIYFSYTWKIPFTFTTKTDSNFNQTANDVIWLEGKDIGMAL